jgi:hypothetical protein
MMLSQFVRARMCAAIPVAVVVAVTIFYAFAGPAAAAPKRRDSVKPTVQIASPSAGAKATATLAVSGTASDNVALARVEVSVDGGAAVVAQSTSSWNASIDTTRYSNGSHTITARAIDTAGNGSSASVTVNVSNPIPDTSPPTVAIASPTAGASVHGALGVSGNAGDNQAVAKVEVQIDGGPYQAASGTSSWQASLDMTQYPDGTHRITARATDTAGLTSSSSLDVVVSNTPVAAPTPPAGAIGGYLFDERDRDGVYEVGEQALANQHLYLYTGAGQYVTNTYSDANGWYQFTGLADGSYRVQFASDSWWAIRTDWVPDTTGSLYPREDVQLTSSARADMGWRPIVRSTNLSAPISSYVGPNGVKVQSYDDVVPAKDIYDRLMTGSLIGTEAQYTTIRFDSQPLSNTSTMASGSNGTYTDYHATSNVDYGSWLDGDNALFHEYGHAWSNYYAYIVQQDPSFTAYLQARGVFGDPRLYSSSAWEPKEMIAEDYRQLFGNANARSATQMNRDIPPAASIPGLRDYLANTFTRPPGS